jgi:hypothetical protein
MLSDREIETLKRVRWIGVVLFAAAAVYAPLQLALPVAVRGAATIGAPALQIVLAVLFGLASIALAGCIPRLWYAVVVGTFALLGYGMLVAMGWFSPGIPFLAAGFVLLYVLPKTAPLFRRPIETVSAAH